MSNCLPEYKGKRYNSLDEIGKDIDHADLSEMYHQSKARKINPSLIDTVEEVLYSKPEDAKVSKAVIKINGKQYQGNNHAEAILKAKEAGEDISKVDRKAQGQFKLSNGEIINRVEAKARFGKDQSELLIPQDEAADQANKDYSKIKNKLDESENNNEGADPKIVLEGVRETGNQDQGGQDGQQLREKEVADVVGGDKDVESTAKALEKNIPKDDQIAIAVTAMPKEGVVSYKEIKKTITSPDYGRYLNRPDLLNDKAKKIYDELSKGGRLRNEKVLLNKNGELKDGTHRFMARLAMGQTDFEYSIPSDNFFSQPYTKTISEAYHKAKADNSNPKLVKAVEDALAVKPDAPLVGNEVNPTNEPIAEPATKPVQDKPDFKLDFVDESLLPTEKETEVIYNGKKIKVLLENQKDIPNQKLVKKQEVIREKLQKLKDLIDCL